ncbi:MAG: hypothetical protein WA957_03495, partial [Alteraurantiacibacter sp.]
MSATWHLALPASDPTLENPPPDGGIRGRETENAHPCKEVSGLGREMTAKYDAMLDQMVKDYS